MEALKEALCPETILVSVMYVNNEVGTLQPIDEAVKIVKEYNSSILFHSDAVQGFGKYHIYPKRQKIDLLSASGHKIHGPKGTGFLYVGEKVKIKPILFGGGQQKDLRSGTENVPGIAGLGLATKMIYNDLDMKVALMRELKDYFIEQAEKIENTTVHGLKDEGSAPHIISLGIAGIRSEVLLHTLEDKGIYVSSGSACASNHPAVSGVLRSIGAAQEYLDATIRFSMSEFTTKEEIEKSIANQNERSKAIEKINADREQLEKRSAEIRTIERDKTSERETSGRELARLEERKINIQKQYDDIISKLWEEYELTRREAEDCAVEIDDSKQAQRRLNELKQKIRSLGNVNVSAIEEYKEVSERYEFMSAQVNDVEKSKKEIEKLITDLTKQMKEVFVESFDQINKNFTYTFKELFGGGTASLSLADPENILTSGIDILVHPPGKIVINLEALSGGEKALVAIALYFAIMKVRPAPFCVMDEIEAALDDVNVYRFAAYLRRMTDNTQFILITHRRGTMEEADVLYGVTMQDEGISKLLELRSTEVAEKLGIDSK